MTLSQLNFCPHPELSDEDFVIATFNVAYNTAPDQASVDAATAAIQSGSRYDLIYGPGGWISQGIKGNFDDAWFKNFPDWGWIPVILVTAVVVGVVAWKCWGKELKNIGNGNGSDEE